MEVSNVEAFSFWNLVRGSGMEAVEMFPAVGAARRKATGAAACVLSRFLGMVVALQYVGCEAYCTVGVVRIQMVQVLWSRSHCNFSWTLLGNSPPLLWHSASTGNFETTGSLAIPSQ